MKYISFILIFIFLVSCAENKRSPDYSNRERAKPTPSEKKNESGDLKGEGEYNPVTSPPSNGFNSNKGLNVRFDCPFYPDSVKGSDWENYINDIQPNVSKSLNLQKKIIQFYTVKGSLQSVLLEKERFLTTSPVKEYKLKQVFDSVDLENCKYPEIRVYENNEGDRAYWVTEWRTSEFYQAEHILLPSEKVLMNSSQNGRLYMPQTLYKDRLSNNEKSLFLRSLLNTYELDIIHSGRMRYVPDNIRLLLTDRKATKVGSLSLRWTEKLNEYVYYFSALDVYRWYTIDNKEVFQVVWGGEPAEFADDEGNIDAAANFDTSKARIHMYIVEPNLNGEIPFKVEVFDLEGQDRYIFAGKRESRQERN